MGPCARLAAAGRSSRQRQGGSPGGRGVRTAQGPLPDVVRLQQRELAQAAGRGRHAHESVPRRAGRARWPNLHRNQVRLRFIGDREMLGGELKRRMEDAESLTEGNSGLGSDGGDGLRRPLGHRPGVPLARGRGRRRDSCRRRKSTRPQVAARLALGGIPDPGSLDPHRRRAAHQQFPAVESRLHRAVFHRRAVAGIHGRRISRRPSRSSPSANAASARPPRSSR